MEHWQRAERWLGGSILPSFMLLSSAFRVTFVKDKPSGRVGNAEQVAPTILQNLLVPRLNKDL